MSSFPTYRFSILIRPKENSGYFTYFITCFKAPCFVFMGPFCGFHPDLSESYSVWPLKYSMLLQQSQFSSTREMNQLMYPWPFATCKIYGAIGSLCTVLLGLAQYVWAKSNLKICFILLLCTAEVKVYFWASTQTKKKALSSCKICCTTVFHLSKCDSSGCWSFFRQRG